MKVDNAKIKLERYVSDNENCEDYKERVEKVNEYLEFLEVVKEESFDSSTYYVLLNECNIKECFECGDLYNK